MRKHVALILLVVLIVFTGCSRNAGPSLPPTTPAPVYTPDITPPSGTLRGSGIGSVAPDFRYRTSDGKTLSLSDLRGKPVYLNFWASWCPPCRAEMPILEQVYRDNYWREKGLQFLTVSIDDTEEKARQFVTDNAYSFPFITDTKQGIANAYNINTIPASLFINKDGVIESRREGAFPNDMALVKELKKIAP